MKKKAVEMEFRLVPEAIADLEDMVRNATGKEWHQGSSTHRAVTTLNGKEYEIADFHHGHEQVTVCALFNAAPKLLEAAKLLMEAKKLLAHGKNCDIYAGTFGFWAQTLLVKIEKLL